jgi:hypothetical protein
MKLEQKKWTETGGWDPGPPGELGDSAQLILLFGSTSMLREKKCLDEIKRVYPKAHLLGCSTAGEIYGTQVFDDSLIVTAVCFERTQLQGLKVSIDKMESSFNVGQLLA